MKKLFTLITLVSAVDSFAASQSNEMDLSFGNGALRPTGAEMDISYGVGSRDGAAVAADPAGLHMPAEIRFLSLGGRDASPSFGAASPVSAARSSVASFAMETSATVVASPAPSRSSSQTSYAMEVSPAPVVASPVSMGRSSMASSAMETSPASSISAGICSSRASSSMNPAVTAADLDVASPLSPLDTAFCMPSSEIVRVVPSYTSGAGQKRGHLPEILNPEPSDLECVIPASKKSRIAKAKLSAATSYISGAGQKRGHLPKVRGFKYTGHAAKRSRVEAVPVESSAVASMGVGAKRERPVIIVRPTILNPKKVSSAGQEHAKLAVKRQRTGSSPYDGSEDASA